MIVLRTFSKKEEKGTKLTDKEINLALASGLASGALGAGYYVAGNRSKDLEMARKLKGNGKILVALGAPLAAAGGYYKYKSSKK